MSIKAVREVAREINKQKQMAADLWYAERDAHLKKSGIGFIRYIDTPSYRAIKTVTERLVGAGVPFADIEAAIRLVASEPRGGPWKVFDVALTLQQERENLARASERIESKAAARTTGLRQPNYAAFARRGK